MSRRRMAAAGSGPRSDPVGGEPLSVEERAELVRFRAQVAEQSKDIAFLKNGAPRTREVA
jgi:transposase